MAKNEALFGYALLDDSKNSVSIDDIDRPFSRLHKFYCPHCHNEMYATFGDIQLPHFRHNGKKCQHSKYLHDLAEYVFYQEYLRCLDNGLPFYLELCIQTPCNMACVLKKHADCKEHYIRKTVDLTKEYTRISLEARVDLEDHYRRPDILLESPEGKQLWVEIWVSHETDEEKRKDGRIIEIKIETENDLERIRQHRIVQSEGSGLAVRIFGIGADIVDGLFDDKEETINTSYPCDNYLCFEVVKGGSKTEVIDKIINNCSSDLSYRVILRLNWQGRHNSTEGYRGTKTTLEYLRSMLTQRYYSNLDNEGSFLDKSYDRLIVSEWKTEIIKPRPVLVVAPHHRSSFRPYDKLLPQKDSTPVDISEVEWVDLGLPSGTLWAKDDNDGKYTFIEAKASYGSYLPSGVSSEELRENCTRAWDGETHSLVLTGPNGNSIAFPCRENYKYYWMNAYEPEDPRFGRCFNIGPDKHFWFSDKDVSSLIYVRLAKGLSGK